MDYKKIFKSRSVRILIMNMLRFIPDKPMISWQYKVKTGHKLNWKNPKRFTEKLQLYKLYAKHHPEMKQCVDKYDVRGFVEERGLANTLIGLVGIYDDPSQIVWEELPDKFVAKDTLGGGGNAVYVCQDKNSDEKEKFYKLCKAWVNDKAIHPGRETVYDGRKHRIIIEEFLEAEDEKTGLVDYKFFCFNGEPQYAYVLANRQLGIGVELGIYDMEYNLLPYYRADEFKPVNMPEKPETWDNMIGISKVLSKEFPEVRVDLYSIKGKVYFGEMTFFDGSGYMTFEPDQFDYIMGEKFVVS